MKVYLCLIALAAAVNGRHIDFTDSHPILSVDTSYGQGDHERVTYLVAQIHPRHVTSNQRINFPTSGYLNDYFQEAKAPGDERGHLVGSQFSGPADWYNLSPQNSRVNRNVGYRSITTDWYGSECEVRRFLDGGANRYVDWTVTMTYVGDSNRPDQYRLQVRFMENGSESGSGIDTTIRNPFLSEDSTFWICRACRSNPDEHDELKKRSDNECSQE